MKKFWVFVFILWPIIAVAASVIAPSQRWWFPGAAQSPIGQQIDDLFYMILIIVTIAFIGTEVALGYACGGGPRYRKPGAGHVHARQPQPGGDLDDRPGGNSALYPALPA